ncbi:MAG: Rod shape-determining protein RodA [Candidatus Woesebacteria bacterium GW2011_GWD2_40_19]|nr:MAG: Rod shape-determining protein RodA [Candidatus Woesebacteria bacterium GW2011_GWD2_40_19]
MRSVTNFLFKDITLSLSMLFLLAFSVVILNSLEKNLFPLYFVYIFTALLVFWIFSMTDFEIISLFSKYLYIISIALLLLTFIIGSVTRNTVRWIQLGPTSLQPAEIIRPFLLVFFANYLGRGEVTLKKIGKALLLLLLPVVLILAQPSLGVSILTIVGFVGVLMASKFNKKHLIVGLLIGVAILPIAWRAMAPYQRQRITSFLEPAKDPRGAGYNSKLRRDQEKFSEQGSEKGFKHSWHFYLKNKQTLSLRQPRKSLVWSERDLFFLPVF